MTALDYRQARAYRSRTLIAHDHSAGPSAHHAGQRPGVRRTYTGAALERRRQWGRRYGPLVGGMIRQAIREADRTR